MKSEVTWLDAGWKPTTDKKRAIYLSVNIKGKKAAIAKINKIEGEIR